MLLSPSKGCNQIYPFFQLQYHTLTTKIKKNLFRNLIIKPLLSFREHGSIFNSAPKVPEILIKISDYSFFALNSASILIFLLKVDAKFSALEE